MNFGVSVQLLFGNIRFKTITVAFDLPDVTKLATVQSKFHQIKLLVYERFHYDDVIMDAMASQITSLTIVAQPFILTQIKENIKGLRHWLLCREFNGAGEFPAQMASNAENVSISWRHHV